MLVLLLSLRSSFVLTAQNKLVVKDWQEYTFASKYGNPITIQWILERSSDRVDYMDNKYHFFFRFRSKTKLYGHKQSVWVGFDIPIEGREYDLEFGQTLFWDRDGKSDFWHASSSPPIEMKVDRGWIGTFSSEIEKSIQKPEDCAKLVEELGAYTGSEMTKQAVNAATSISGFFDEKITNFIATYSSSASALFKITSSTTVGIIIDLVNPVKMSTHLEGYENAHQNAKRQSTALKISFITLGKLNASQQSPPAKSTKNSNSLDSNSDFWNTPENSQKVHSRKERTMLIQNIEKKQKELKKALDDMDLALKLINIEKLVKDDCRKKALEQYHASFKYNAEVLLKITKK